MNTIHQIFNLLLLEYFIFLTFEGRLDHMTGFAQWSVIWNDVLLPIPPPPNKALNCQSETLCITWIYRRSKQPEILIAHKGQLPWTVTGCGGFCPSKLLLSVNPLRIWAQLGHHNLIMMFPWIFVASKKMQNLFKGRCFHMTFRVNMGDFLNIRDTTQNLYNK